MVPPEASIAVEAVLLAAGEQIGHENLSYASRMNKAVVVFLKEECYVNRLIESGVFLNDVYVQVSPLSVPSTRVTVSGVPPFIPNEELERELRRFGKFASSFKNVNLGCKDPKLKHVQSLRRQVFMFLDAPNQTLDVSFRVKYETGYYMVYASSGSMKCFECGDVGHKRFACPHYKNKTQGNAAESTSGPSVAAGEGSDGQSMQAEVQVSLVHKDQEASSQLQQPGNDLNEAAVNSATGLDTTAGPSGEIEESDAAAAEVSVETGGSQAESSQVESRDEGGVSKTPVVESRANSELEEMDEDSESDSSQGSDLYSVEQINSFLNETFGKKVQVEDHFPDTDKFIRSCAALRKKVGCDLLDEKKRFRLRKHVTSLRKKVTGARKRQAKSK